MTRELMIAISDSDNNDDEDDHEPKLFVACFMIYLLTYFQPVLHL